VLAYSLKVTIDFRGVVLCTRVMQYIINSIAKSVMITMHFAFSMNLCYH
jgi:hypothetical protein